MRDEMLGGAAHDALAGLACDGVGFAIGVDEGYAHWMSVCSFDFKKLNRKDAKAQV